MKKTFKILILFIALIPAFSFAQFTGYQDETAGNKTIWEATSNFEGGTNTDLKNGGVDFKGTSNVTNSTVNTNTNTNNFCTLGAKTIAGIVDYIGCAVRVAVFPFIFTLALLSFVWGVTVMLRNPASEEAQTKGRTFILWGIIGFFVITSVYALVAIIRRTIGFGSNFEKDTTPYVQLKEKVQNLK